MSELVLSFDSDGRVAGLHMDQFDLSFLGRKTVKRQTDILFDPDTQQWGIHYLDEGASTYIKEIGTCPTYEEARKREVEWLNRCRLQGVPPTSEQGLSIAAACNSSA